MQPTRFRHRLLMGPNLVTLIRPLCTGLFLWLGWQHQPLEPMWTGVGLLSVFGLTVISDIWDGWLARRWQQESDFGRWLDHSCDVAFILAVQAFFVTHGLIPWWLPVAIAWSFSLYVVRSGWWAVGLSQPTVVASRLGHLGGVLYYTVVGLVTAEFCLGEPVRWVTGWLPAVFTLLALLALIAGLEHAVLILRSRTFLNRAAPTVKTPTQSDY